MFDLGRPSTKTTHPSKRRFVNRHLDILTNSRHFVRVGTDRRNVGTRRDATATRRRRSNDPSRATLLSDEFSIHRTRCFSRMNNTRRCARAPNAPRHRARRRVHRKAGRNGSIRTASITRARADAGKKVTMRSPSRTPTIDRCTRSIAGIQTAMKRIRIPSRARVRESADCERLV